MNKIQIAPGIVVYDDVIDNYETLVHDLEDAMTTEVLQWKEPMISRDNVDIVDYHVRNLHTLGIDYEESKTLLDEWPNPIKAFHNILGNKLYTGLDRVEKDYQNMFQCTMHWHDVYNVLKYGTGHFFNNHTDDGESYHRRMSIVYYMNDDYTGGEILFPRFDVSYKPKANQAIMFPSNYMYNHSVSAVTSGTRYAVASWMR